ncbi:hypothetical protein SLA2020_036150 [Shorea laevis]
MAEDSEMASSTSQLQSSSQISHKDAAKRSQIPAFSGFLDFPNGIYVIPVLPFVGRVSGLPSNTLIPLTYNIPTRPANETGSGGEEHGQAAQPQQHQQQRAGAQGQVVRRFQIAFQLDLLLVLKLAAAIFLFNQDGSRQRLVVLVFFASLVYLYQTRALTPLVRWLSQSMQRAAAPPHPPRPAVRAENVPAEAGNGNEHAALAEGEAGAENGIRQAEGNGAAVENENVVEGGIENGGNHWWGIVNEIQMIIFGFITSLLPGFHSID